MYKKILVPIDGSKYSLKALEHASVLASKLDSEISLLYVAEDFNVVQQQILPKHVPDHLYNEIKEFAKNMLNEARTKLPVNVRVENYLEFGSPRECIVRFARDNDYDLIIIGKRGLGRIKGMIMGSVSSYVVSESPCPVLVMK